PPHHLRRDGKEVYPVLPANFLLTGQTQVRLVDERRRLQRVSGVLASKIMRSEPAQILIDQGHQCSERFFVTVTPGDKQLGDFLWGLRCHNLSVRAMISLEPA